MVLVVFWLGSCSRGDSPQTPVLPPTDIAALRPTWAVVTDSYVRLHTQPRADAPIVGHLRHADVAAITAISANGVRIGARRHHWYLFEHETVRGWALDRHVEPFGSESRARNAAVRLLEPDP